MWFLEANCWTSAKIRFVSLPSNRSAHWAENKTQSENPLVTQTHNYLPAMQSNLLSHYSATFKCRIQSKNWLSRYTNDDTVTCSTAEHQIRPPRAQENAEYIPQVKGSISTAQDLRGKETQQGSHCRKQPSLLAGHLQQQNWGTNP